MKLYRTTMPLTADGDFVYLRADNIGAAMDKLEQGYSYINCTRLWQLYNSPIIRVTDFEELCRQTRKENAK